MSMNDRNALMRQLMQAYFAMFEIHLYLDTHPHDHELDSLMDMYMVQAQKLAEQYESCYGPITCWGASGENWLKGPWPWENARGDC